MSSHPGFDPRVFVGCVIVYRSNLLFSDGKNRPLLKRSSRNLYALRGHPAGTSLGY